MRAPKFVRRQDRGAPVPASRRVFLAGLAAILTAIRARADAPDRLDALQAANERITAIEAREGGRLGVAVLDAAGGVMLAHRGDERFPMCSTFKLLAAAAVLARVDAGADGLGRRVTYGPADLLSYAPVTKAHVGEGGMALGDLCAAAIDWSDNTAANLVLETIGGPEGFTRFARGLGDPVTRLDRNEPSLNSALPGDERDTTTPMAMARDIKAVLLGDRLGESSRRQLEAWLIADKVGGKRLRAGLPPDWRVGDKTGSGDNGTANTIAILRPPGRPPLLAAVYYTGSSAPTEARNDVHKQIGALIAATF
jgi:beta-lactamase class A